MVGDPPRTFLFSPRLPPVYARPCTPYYRLAGDIAASPPQKRVPSPPGKNPPGIFNPFGGNAHDLGTMKKEKRPDWKERHKDIERLFELGLIDLQEMGEAIHRILYDEISQELDQMIRIKLEDGF